MRGRPPSVCDCVCGGKARIHKGEAGFYVRCERDPGVTSAPEYCTPKRAANAWNSMQNQMAQLSRDAICAYHEGKSYGQYMAGRPPEHPVERYPKKVEGTKIPELRCLCCNMLIPPGSRKRRYCSPICAEKFRLDQKRQYYQKKSDDRPACQECGQQIPVGSNRRKYCSAACADIAAERQRNETKRRKRRNGNL